MTNACAGLASSSENSSSASATESTPNAETSSNSTSLPSYRKISLRQLSDRCATCDAELAISQLEMEAVAAVRELASSVKVIAVSDLLPRTSELVFINVTTLEGNVYCVELTRRGWRVASSRHDCMNGDFMHLELHIRYFETIYKLLDTFSPEYHRRFCGKIKPDLEEVAEDLENKVQS